VDKIKNKITCKYNKNRVRGAYDFYFMSLTEIAEKENLSREQVRRLLKSAIKKLKIQIKKEKHDCGLYDII
jgi:DNA-directed RNA polymerase sigma subunit (sigma70/sigma32)